MLPYHANEGKVSKFCPRELSGTPGPRESVFPEEEIQREKNWEARTRQETGPQSAWVEEVGGTSGTTQCAGPAALSANGSARLHSGPALFLGSRNGGLRKVFPYRSDMLITDF